MKSMMVPVVVVADREVDVMAILVALDDDLVAAASHDGGPAPTLALVELIAHAGRILPQVDLALEVIQLRVHAALSLSRPCIRARNTLRRGPEAGLHP